LSILFGLKKAYNIPAANFIGHADIAPTRKNDPNVNFPWKRLADSGYGTWWSDTTGMVVPDDFNHLQALRLIGYDTRDSVAVFQTFKRKYEQIDSSKVFLPEDRKVLYSLYKNF
jgi:N-acetylmuramoyl-L-alanine amidase